MFYSYLQNNPGGVDTGPARYVVIEADSPEQSDTFAEEHGLYFNSEFDCACCGPRWTSQTGYLGDQGTEKLSDVYSYDFSYEEDNIPGIMLVTREGGISYPKVVDNHLSL